MYIVHKQVIDGTEYLPDITQTDIWQDFDRASMGGQHNLTTIIAQLYMAVAQRENYFQDNRPTAFGNPDFSFYSGKVLGILLGGNLEEYVDGNTLVFRRGNRRVLVVDKIRRNPEYYQANRENNELLGNVF